MLKIKFVEEFKSGNPFVVFLGDLDGLKKAQLFFQNTHGAYLNDTALIDVADIGVLQSDQLWLNKNECIKMAESLNLLITADQPAHAYLDSEALGNEIEIIISYNEYEDI